MAASLCLLASEIEILHNKLIGQLLSFNQSKNKIHFFKMHSVTNQKPITWPRQLITLLILIKGQITSDTLMKN